MYGSQGRMNQQWFILTRPSLATIPRKTAGFHSTQYTALFRVNEPEPIQLNCTI